MQIKSHQIIKSNYCIYSNEKLNITQAKITAWVEQNHQSLLQTEQIHIDQDSLTVDTC